MVEHTARRPEVEQPAGEAIGDGRLVLAEGRGVPLGVVGSLGADEGRLTADAQPHVLGHEDLVHGVAQGEDPLPLALAVGLRHPGAIDHPHHAHVEVELALDVLDEPRDRRRGGRARRRRERDVSLRGEQPRRSGRARSSRPPG